MRHSNNFIGIRIIAACAILAACNGNEAKKLEDFASFGETRKMLDNAFECSWAINRGLPACVRHTSANVMNPAKGDDLVTILIGPPKSGEKLGLKLNPDMPEAEKVKDYYSQIEPASVTGLQFKMDNLSTEQVRDFLLTHFLFTADEIDSVLGDWLQFQQTLESGDMLKALEIAKQGGQRHAVVHGRLRLVAGGSEIQLQRTRDGLINHRLLKTDRFEHGKGVSGDHQAHVRQSRALFSAAHDRGGAPLRRTYPVVASKCLRAIHRLANANSVTTCAPFFANPR